MFIPGRLLKYSLRVRGQSEQGDTLMTLRIRTVSTIAVAAVALTLAISTVSGQPATGRGPGGRGRGFGPGGPFPALRQLNLTEAQREQVKSLMTQVHSENEQAAGDRARKVGDLHSALQAAIFADTPDPAQIEQLRATLAEAQAAALTTRIEIEQKIAQILTPEQRKQARELAAQRPGRRSRASR
jgi:protein CpxP